MTGVVEPLHVQRILDRLKRMMDPQQETLKCELKIPFPSDREAEIAYNSLRVDKEPRKGQITKELSFDGNVLLVNFTATEARFLRVAVGSFFDLLNLVVKTMDEFGPPLERSHAAPQTEDTDVTNDVS